MSSAETPEHWDADPGVVIPAVWFAAHTGKVQWEVAIQFATSPELARNAGTESLPPLTAALAAAERLGPAAFRLATLIEMHASVLDELGCNRLALPLYDAVRPLYMTYANQVERGNFLMHRAVVLNGLGSPDAIAEYDEALQLLRVHATPANVGRCQANRANALFKQSRVAEAVAGYDDALLLVAPADRAGCLMNRAVALQELGRMAEAVTGYNDALPLLVAPADRALCLMNRAGALQELGRVDEAVTGYDEALPLLRVHATPANVGRCQANRANALFKQSKFADAEAGYNAALLLLREHATPVDVATCLANRANVLFKQGGAAAAITEFDKDLLFICEHAAPATLAACRANRIVALEELGRFDEALDDYEVVLSLLREHAPAEYGKCLMNRAGALYQLNRLDEAVVEYDLAFREARRSRRHASTDDASLESYEVWDGLYRRAVRAGLASNLPDAAYAAVREGKAGVVDDLRFKLQATLGSESPTVIRARRDLTDWMRTRVPQRSASDLPTDDETGQFHKELDEFSRGRDERTAAYFTAWGQHAHAYDPGRATLPEVEEPPTRAEIQEVLPERWAILDFWQTGADEFRAFVLIRDELREFKLSFPVEKYLAKLTRLSESLRGVGDAEPQLEGLDELGTHLFRPLQSHLREKHIVGLYLVPHGFLHLFPLHAARYHDGSKGIRHLCDDFEVAYLPSASMLPRLPQLDLKGRPFVLANPEAGTDRSLPFSHWEGLRLSELLGVPSETFFLGEKGRYAATDHWGDSGYVHLSCHGHGDEAFAPPIALAVGRRPADGARCTAPPTELEAGCAGGSERLPNECPGLAGG